MPKTTTKLAKIELAEDGLPIFEVKAVGHYKGIRRQDGTRYPDSCLLVFKCPMCGRRTQHGGIYKGKGQGDGHRTSHCECWPNGYYIKEA